jgi:hypothetical protein
MGLFRRRKETLAERLLREGGLAEPVGGERESTGREDGPPRGPLDPFAGRFVDSESRAVTHRLREWDVLVNAEAPDLPGAELDFISLPDGTVLVDEELGDADLAPLAEAVETRLSAPYRARAVRQSATRWAVSANRIEVARLPIDGDVVELASHAGVQTAVVDGETVWRALPELERLGERTGADYAVRAERLDGDLWEVRVSPL